MQYHLSIVLYTSNSQKTRCSYKKGIKEGIVCNSYGGEKELIHKSQRCELQVHCQEALLEIQCFYYLFIIPSLFYILHNPIQNQNLSLLNSVRLPDMSYGYLNGDIYPFRGFPGSVTTGVHYMDRNVIMYSSFYKGRSNGQWINYSSNIYVY